MKKGETPAQGAPKEIDVILNGGRTYVQGVQLLARAAEIARDVEGAEDLMLKSAAFRAITDQRVAVRVLGPDEAPGEESLGEAVFAGGSAPPTVAFHALDGMAPKGDRPERCSYALIDGTRAAPLTAGFEVAGLETLEDALVAIVQTVKRLHQDLAPDVADIWFTGMRGAALPADGALSAASGRIDVAGGRVMGKAPTWQTLQKVTMTDASGGKVFAAMVNFAFKSDAYQTGAR